MTDKAVVAGTFIQWGIQRATLDGRVAVIGLAISVARWPVAQELRDRPVAAGIWAAQGVLACAESAAHTFTEDRRRMLDDVRQL